MSSVVKKTRISPEDRARLVAMLEAIVEDRTLLADMPRDERVSLLQAAGRLSRPTRHEQQRATKAFRVITHQQKKAHDRDLRAATEIRAARRAEVFEAPKRVLGTEGGVGELTKARDCYVCKTEFRAVHPFYDAMCTPCAELNYEKRFQTASLVGKVALITGARIKIGYQAALMMLRAGAHVIVTTRFPRDAASRYAREADFEKWKDRLEIHGLDLRHVPSVELFARFLVQSKSRLDILINNAAQTVRRPAGFYTHMLELETQPLENLPENVRYLLREHEQCKSALALEAGSDFVGLQLSAERSQLPCAFDDRAKDGEVFPLAKLDADLQQIDLRKMNSWRMTLAEVPAPEMLEVQLVNSVAPFVLCAKLKDLMMRAPGHDKHIVNVSAMEGQFARRTKTDKHPHTNMAKAALNMMTLTSAPDYAKSGIFMNAVDTGWVTDEDPAQLSQRKRNVHDFEPPLDVVDGAARICDPFFSGLLTGNHVWGKFLKDYKPCEW